MLRKHAFFFVGVLVASLCGDCFAQSNSQSTWTDSTTTKVKPEMRKNYEGHLKQLMAAYKKAGTPWFLTFENFAGDTTEYTSVVPVMKFGDLDGPSIVAKVLGKEGWQHLSRHMAECYTAQSRQYAMSRTELEINHKDVPVGTYWVETSILVAPGKMRDYLSWLQDEYLPALEKAGVAHFQVSQPIFGTPAGEIVTMRMLKSLSEIDGGPILSKALNEEAARAFNAKSVAFIASSNTWIVRVRADLSYSAGN
jgi:hypothetical protein